LPCVGGPLAEERVDLASQTALPERPSPQGPPERVWGGRCSVGDRQGRGRPPARAPDHAGATAQRVGSRGMAAAPAWPDGVGLPGRPVPTVLRCLTGGQRTQEPLTQEALRRAAGVEGPVYAQWRAALPAAPVVQPAATGGRVSGAPAILRAVATAAPVYPGRARRWHAAVQEGMPADAVGGMVTARGRRDEAQALDAGRTPPGRAPIPRSLSDVLATKPGRARDGGAGLNARRQDARQRWQASHDGAATDGVTAAKARREELTDQRRARPLTAPDQHRWRKALGGQHDRGNLVRGLDDPRLEPTHNRAAPCGDRPPGVAVLAKQPRHTRL
jgi:hypothetical protein